MTRLTWLTLFACAVFAIGVNFSSVGGGLMVQSGIKAMLLATTVIE